MLTVLWSVKGGVGVSVASAMFALTASKSRPCLLVDAGGDQPAILGTAEPEGPTLSRWMSSPSDVGIDSLRRVEHRVADSFSLLMVGGELAHDPDRLLVAARLLAQPDRTVVVDLGNLDSARAPSHAAFANAVLGVADQSLLVTTPCYLALRRAQGNTALPTGVVLIDQPERALRRSDVEAALGVPIICTISHSASLARTVDAGLLLSRLPNAPQRGIRRCLDGVAV